MSHSSLPPAHSLTRRGAIRAGWLGLGGLSLVDLLRLQSSAGETANGRKPAKNVIVLFLSGGPSQLDMWDMKPRAPEEIRGTFRPVSTKVPGLQVCEHLPRTAALADKCCIVRSVHHTTNSHPAACFWMMTGSRIARPQAESNRLSRADRPHLGSALSAVLGGRQPLPATVMLPEMIQPNGPPRSGQHAGFLGPAHDPYLIHSNPNDDDFSPGAVRPLPGLTAERLGERSRLLATINSGRFERSSAASRAFGKYHDAALDLLNGPAAQRAFDLTHEPDAVRDRYGRHVFGQSTLLARRLIEAGVRLVHVNWVRHDGGFGGQGYDSHRDHLQWSKDELLPPTDAAFASLLEDLEDRGLLDETLVVMMGEFGRTPRFNQNGGRDHWSRCFSVMLAGGGIPGGAIYGASDATAAYPAADAVTPDDLAATIFTRLGVNPATHIHDELGRPFKLTEGRAIAALV